MRRLIATIVLLAPLAALGADSAADARALFERDWQWQLQHDPELATAIGDHRYDGQLSDTSLAASAARIEHARRMLDEARRIDPEELPHQDRLSWELFTREQERRLAVAGFVAFDPLPIAAQDGLHVRLPQLFAQMPYVTEDDYANYLARLGALPRHVDGLIEQLREGMRTGWTAPKIVIAPVPDALRALREHLADSPVGAPLGRLPATLSEEARTRIARDGADALQAAAAALRRLEDFIRTDYLPAARTSIAASSLPGGPAWYALQVKLATTSALTPADIHAIGLKEVARIRAELQAAVPRTGFRGTLAEFLVFARTDPRLFPKDGAALLDRYRATVARASLRLPRIVGIVPGDELAVKPAQAGADGRGGAYYSAGTADRAAALVVNTSHLDARPLWEVETLALHEGVPGHHLQFARAEALSDLPAFRRHAWYPAFGEGWALYAESLGPELGLTTDAFSAFGRLADEQLRAARLVIDTGIHALGWTRQQALDYLNANTANPPSDNALEVDRSIAQPGQLLAYKIGQLRIAALRRQAENQLRDRFDERAFHDAILADGALPLDLLDTEMEHWIAAQLPAPVSAPASAPTSAPAPSTAPVK